MTHRIALYLLLLVALASTAHAQLSVTLNVAARPSPYISEWVAQREMAIMTVTNSSPNEIAGKLRAKVSRDQTLQAETITELMPVQYFPPGTTTVYADVIVPADAVRFHTNVVGLVRRTGMLPSGTYEFCVDIVDPQQGATLTAPACRLFTITAYQLPDLQLPANGTQLTGTSRPTFRWSPIMPTPSGGARYMLTLFELLPGQTASSTLENGFRIYEREVVGMTQLLWPADLVLPEREQTYVWSVQCIDASGRPVGDRDGWADPFTFSVISPRDTGSGEGITSPRDTVDTLYVAEQTVFVKSPRDTGDTLYIAPQVVFIKSPRDSGDTTHAVSGGVFIKSPSGSGDMVSITPGTVFVKSIRHNGDTLYISPKLVLIQSPRDTGSGGPFGLSDDTRRLAGMVRHASTRAPVTSAKVVYRTVRRTFDTDTRGGRLPFQEAVDSLESRTGADGDFRFDNTTDSSYFSLRVSADGFHSVHEMGTAQFQRGDIAGYEILLTPVDGSIRGIVRDSLSKEALGNITVELWQRNDRMVDGAGVTRRQPGIGVSADQLVATTSTHSTYGTTHARGSAFDAGGKSVASSPGGFSFSDIPSGDGYYLAISDPGYREYRSSEFSISGEQQLDAVLLQPRTGTIEGWVLEEGTDKPLAGSMVYLYSHAGAAVNIGINYLAGLHPSVSHDSLGTTYWNPAAANASRVPELKELISATGANSPYIPETSARGGRLRGSLIPSDGNAGSSSGTGGRTITAGSGNAGLTNWAASSAWWGATTLTGDGTPELKPDSIALYGPVLTDANGYFVFTDVRLNDPGQPTDQYAVWAVTPGYADTWEATRLFIDGQTRQVTLTTSVSPGFIYGTATNKKDGTPVASVKVELQKRVGTTYATMETAWTDSDGAYTLFGMESGTYDRVRFSKTGISEHIASGPIEIANGTALELNVALGLFTGTVRGTVKDSRNTGLAGVMISSPDVGSISGTTFSDGTYLLANVPVGSFDLVFTQPGFADATVAVTLASDGDTVTANASMSAYTGSIQIFVMDAVTRDAIQGATVTLDGSQVTDVNGRVAFADVTIGARSLTVTADTAEESPDYETFNASMTIELGANPPDTVYLQPGARITGVVRNQAGDAVDSVDVEIEGIDGIQASTRSDGRFTLRNIPVGRALTLKASKIGFVSDSVEVEELDAGEQRSGIVITLEETPMLTLFGFAVKIDAVEESGSGGKLVTGSIVSVPSNPVMAMRKSGTKLPFERIEVDASYNPVARSYALAVEDVAVTVFGIEATMQGDGSPLTVSWIDSISAGQISGTTVVLDSVIPKWIPGSNWAAQKLTWAADQLPAAFWSDAAFHADPGGLGLAVTGSSVSTTLFGFTLTLDYTKSKIESDGLSFTGSMKVSGLHHAIEFEQLRIVLDDPETGKVKFGGMTFKTDPPLSVSLGVFTIVDSAASMSEQGWKTRGAVYLTTLGNRKIGFELTISNDTEWNVTLEPGASDLSLTMFGSTFDINSADMGRDAGGALYFMFSGALSLPQFDEPVEFESLKFTQEGEFTGTITFNQTMSFSVVTVQLQSLQFGESSGKKYLAIKGGITFTIPGLSAQAGNFRVWENGTFELEQIGVSFTAGPVSVALAASWSDDVFSGQGTLIVDPVLSVSGEFRYAGSSDWYIRIKSSLPPIPIGPFTITGIAGSLGRDGSSWMFGVGGTVSVAAAEKAIALNVFLEVTTTGAGPIIEGTADVTVMGSTRIGTAEVMLDVPDERFTGSIEFGWSMKGIDIAAWIDLEIDAGESWFVGGGVSATLLSKAELSASVYIGNNYDGYMHTLPVSYHPDNSELNGFHLDASLRRSDDKKDAKWSVSFTWDSYVAIDWDMDLSGGIAVRGSALADIWLLGGSASFEVEAAFSYSSGDLRFRGSVEIEAQGWIRPCDSKDDCDRWCVACVDLGISVAYASGDGWDWELDW